jgi:hypothetical protein
LVEGFFSFRQRREFAIFVAGHKCLSRRKRELETIARGAGSGFKFLASSRVKVNSKTLKHKVHEGHKGALRIKDEGTAEDARNSEHN